MAEETAESEREQMRKLATMHKVAMAAPSARIRFAFSDEIVVAGKLLCDRAPGGRRG